MRTAKRENIIVKGYLLNYLQLTICQAIPVSEMPINIDCRYSSALSLDHIQKVQQLRVMETYPLSLTVRIVHPMPRSFPENTGCIKIIQVFKKFEIFLHRLGVDNRKFG